MATNNVLQRIKDLYLQSEGADVWFIFGNERIPGHKFIVSIGSPWLNTMFNGSLPENAEVNMNECGVTANTFKELLRFIYTQNVNFTMDTIQEIIHLAKQSLNDDFFDKCEQFLINSLTFDNIFFGYQLALLYEANDLKKKCEEEICVYAEQVFKSSSFLNFPFEYLENILKCDALACEEKEIFDIVSMYFVGKKVMQS